MTYTNITKKTWDLIFSMYEIKMNEEPLYNFVTIKNKFGFNTKAAQDVLDYLQSRDVIYMKKVKREIKTKKEMTYDLSEKAVKMVEMFQKSPEMFEMAKELGVYPFGMDIPKKKEKTLA